MGEVVDLQAARARRVKRIVTPPADPRLYLFGSGTLAFPQMCSGFVHNFMSVPGHCNCGQHYYDGADEARSGVYSDPMSRRTLCPGSGERKP